MNKIILAPAGRRKTQSIIDCCNSWDSLKRRLIVIYTIIGQKFIRDRLRQCNYSGTHLDVIGWYSFFFEHFIYRYVYDLYPEEAVTGLHFVEGKDPRNIKPRQKDILIILEGYIAIILEN